MKYIKYYKTLSEFNSDEKDKPNVSYIEELDELRYLGDNILQIDDSVLKAILVENFDTDGDGELSKEEALAVTEPFPSLILYSEAVDLTPLKYFKNVQYAGDLSALFRYADTSKPNTWKSISFDGCNFSHATSLKQIFSNRKLTFISMKNCDFRNVTNWQDFCPSVGTQKDLVVDFSGSEFTAFENITNCTRFLYSAKSYKFIMDSCDSTSLETIKSIINSVYIPGWSNKITIDIDGKRWTLTGSTPDQTWSVTDI